MVFSSFLFLFLFLPLFLACYYLAPSHRRNLVALTFSYFFYSWGAPRVVLILLASSLADYFLGRRIGDTKYPLLTRRRLLTLAIGLNLALLVYYKYANFFLTEVNRFGSWLGFDSVVWTHVVLPIGISFFTFQKISYLVDVYRGKAPPAGKVTDYLLYVALFPQLIAGPIIRYHDIAAQIRERKHSIDDFFYGMYRFSIGLGKKVLIADTLGAVTDNVFDLKLNHLDMGYAWLGILCYAFQIYFDFSGYSDMAIGLGRMMGFRFLENFNLPYISQTFTEFWRRWHISLSNWMREYLYIPLGGNRVSSLRMYCNLWLVFLLSGLWHGASWTFVVWGIFHGTFLAIDKLFWLRASEYFPKIAKVALTFVLVLIGWVFFRAETLPQALQFLSVMFDPQTLSATPRIFRGDIIHNRAVFVLVIACMISFAPIFWSKNKEEKVAVSYVEGSHVFAQGATAMLLLLLSAGSLASAHYTPFLYFKF